MGKTIFQLIQPTSLFKLSPTKKLDIMLIFLLIALTIAIAILIHSAIVGDFSSSGRVLKRKPELPGYIFNSDLISKKTGWFSDEVIPLPATLREVLEDTFGWESNGYIEMNEGSRNRKGIAVIYPVSRDATSFIETPEFVLPEKGYIIIGFANVHNYLWDGSRDADNIFKVFIVASDTGTKRKIDEFVISGNHGWKDIAYSIDNLPYFQGNDVRIRVEGRAGGKNEWWGEWAAVDYIDVIQ